MIVLLLSHFNMHIVVLHLPNQAVKSSLPQLSLRRFAFETEKVGVGVIVLREFGYSQCSIRFGDPRPFTECESLCLLSSMLGFTVLVFATGH